MLTLISRTVSMLQAIAELAFGSDLTFDMGSKTHAICEAWLAVSIDPLAEIFGAGVEGTVVSEGVAAGCVRGCALCGETVSTVAGGDFGMSANPRIRMAAIPPNTIHRFFPRSHGCGVGTAGLLVTIGWGGGEMTGRAGMTDRCAHGRWLSARCNPCGRRPPSATAR